MSKINKAKAHGRKKILGARLVKANYEIDTSLWKPDGSRSEKTVDDLARSHEALREALKRAPHQEYCEYWDECSCFKNVLHRDNTRE